MQHGTKKRTFGRERDQRVAFIQSLAEALIEREKIVTTEARAKEIRPFVEKLITTARRGTIAARRTVLSALGGRSRATTKLFTEIAPRFKTRPGGYTRITKVVKKTSDGRSSAVIEFV